MRFKAQLFNPASPFFIGEDSIPAAMELSAGQFIISWQFKGRNLAVKANFKRQLHYFGSLLEADSGLSLGKVAIDARDTMFTWSISLLEGRDSSGNLSYCPLYNLIIQPLALAPDLPLISLSGEFYLLPDQFSALIAEYLAEKSHFWDLYYSSCCYGGEVTQNDVLSLSVFKGISTNLPESMAALWRQKDIYSLELGLLSPAISVEDPRQMALFNRILEDIPGLSLFGVSAFMARHLPHSMPLLSSVMQSWYSGINDNEGLLRVFHEISLDLEKNQAVLSNIKYQGVVLPAALCWSLGLMALAFHFSR